MNLTLATPERKLYDNVPVKKLVIPTASGEITILPKHAPLMSSLARGEMVVQLENDETDDVFVSGGVVQVVDDLVTILANVAEKAHEIDEASIEESIRKAQLKAEEKTEDVDQAEVQAQIANDLARLKLVSKYKAKKSH